MDPTINGVGFKRRLPLEETTVERRDDSDILVHCQFIKPIGDGAKSKEFLTFGSEYGSRATVRVVFDRLNLIGTQRRL